MHGLRELLPKLVNVNLLASEKEALQVVEKVVHHFRAPATQKRSVHALLWQNERHHRLQIQHTAIPLLVRQANNGVGPLQRRGLLGAPSLLLAELIGLAGMRRGCASPRRGTICR